MQNSREDRVWRTLALAFGDGLAFGAGMTLTRNAVRTAAVRNTPELHPLARRVSEIEQRIEWVKINGGATPAVLDSRITDLAAHCERHIAELEVKMKIQAEALHGRDRELAREFDAQMAAFRGQIAALHREFAETLSHLVQEQIDAGVSARLAPMESRLRETIGAEIDSRLAARDRQVLDLVRALGRTCLETADRISPQVGSGGGGSASQLTIQPAFGAEPNKLLRRAPLVSTFFALTCGLLALHYL